MPWISGRKLDPLSPPKQIFFYFSSNIPHSHPAQSSSHRIPTQSWWAENISILFRINVTFCSERTILPLDPLWRITRAREYVQEYGRAVLNHRKRTPIIMIPHHCFAAVTSFLLGQKVSLPSMPVMVSPSPFSTHLILQG